MKAIQDAWQMNGLEAWTLAVAIMLGTALVLEAAKYVALLVLRVVSRRIAISMSTILIDVAHATKVWLLFPVAIYAGASALDLPPRLGTVIDRLAVISVLLQAAVWSSRFIRSWLARRIEERRGMDGESVTVLTLLGILARTVVWVFVLLLILDHLGFDITALVTGLGIGGIAIALAVQSILGDLLASLSIVLDKPFVVGDFIASDGWLGSIERIGIKTTHIRSLSGEQIILSNAELLKMRIHNYKRMQERRVVFGFRVLYETPADALERIPKTVRGIIEAQPNTRVDRAHFQKYGEWSLDFEVVYYVLSPDYNLYMDIQQNINLEIYRVFEREGVGFARPTRTLYVNDVGKAAPAEA